MRPNATDSIDLVILRLRQGLPGDDIVEELLILGWTRRQAEDVFHCVSEITERGVPFSGRMFRHLVARGWTPANAEALMTRTRSRLFQPQPSNELGCARWFTLILILTIGTIIATILNCL